jgi:tRNA(Phe) wybutosine-synthesizing methylase Tyw3
MTQLTQDQYDSLLSNYAESLVDGMDMDSLVQFAIEQIEENVRRMFSLDEELIEEISRFYDDEQVASMLEDVGANPSDFLDTVTK